MTDLTEVLPQVRASKKMLAWLKAKAAEHDRSVSYLIREALTEYIERKTQNGEQTNGND